MKKIILAFLLPLSAAVHADALQDVANVFGTLGAGQATVTKIGDYSANPALNVNFPGAGYDVAFAGAPGIAARIVVFNPLHSTGLGNGVSTSISAQGDWNETNLANFGIRVTNAEGDALNVRCLIYDNSALETILTTKGWLRNPFTSRMANDTYVITGSDGAGKGLNGLLPDCVVTHGTYDPNTPPIVADANGTGYTVQYPDGTRQRLYTKVPVNDLVSAARKAGYETSVFYNQVIEAREIATGNTLRLRLGSANYYYAGGTISGFGIIPVIVENPGTLQGYQVPPPGFYFSDWMRSLYPLVVVNE